jgi:hypothetical protein
VDKGGKEDRKGDQAFEMRQADHCVSVANKHELDNMSET